MIQNSSSDVSSVPGFRLRTSSRVHHSILLVAVGVLTLAMLSKISIPLSFTPVPITGQTFGVAIIALLLGRLRGVAIVATYLALGSAGFPFFAMTKTAAGLGPTSGYLLGMLGGAFVMGTLSDRGWTRSFKTAWAAALCGSLVTFACGLAVLSIFVPDGTLLAAGLWPFIPGDFVKTLLAAILVSRKGIR